MDEQELLANRFEEHRTRLRAVAYRMLGSLDEADGGSAPSGLVLGTTWGALPSPVPLLSCALRRGRRLRPEFGWSKGTTPGCASASLIGRNRAISEKPTAAAGRWSGPRSS
jgi:hypothetical protein